MPIPAEAPALAGMPDGAEKHRAAVEWASPWPHRNELLARQSVLDEVVFPREPLAILSF